MKKGGVNMKKKILIISSGLIILLLIVGTYMSMKDSSTVNNANIKANNELEIYLIDGNNIQRRLIERYKKEYPNVTVKEVLFDTYEEYSNRLNTELLAGKGPDIIFVQNTGLKRLNKLMESNIFFDINELIKQDSQFNINDYNSIVMNCGVYKDKRIIMPFNYSLETNLIVNSSFEQYGVKINGNENLEEIINLLQEYFKEEKYKNNEQYLTMFLDFSNLFSYEELGVINFKNKKVDFNNEKFKTLVETYKKMSPAITPQDLIFKYKNGDLDMLISNKILLTKMRLNPMTFYPWYNYIAGQVNGKVELLPNINNSVAMVGYFSAINNNSKNKQEAYNFIKLSLSEQYQENVNNHNDEGLIPVNNKALASMKMQAKNKNGSYVENVVIKELPQDIQDKYENVLNNFNKAIINDYSIDIIVLEEVKQYINGTKSYEAAINEINRKVKLYLDE